MCVLADCVKAATGPRMLDLPIIPRNREPQLSPF